MIFIYVITLRLMKSNLLKCLERLFMKDFTKYSHAHSRTMSALSFWSCHGFFHLWRPHQQTSKCEWCDGKSASTEGMALIYTHSDPPFWVLEKAVQPIEAFCANLKPRNHPGKWRVALSKDIQEWRWPLLWFSWGKRALTHQLRFMLLPFLKQRSFQGHPPRGEY